MKTLNIQHNFVRSLMPRLKDSFTALDLIRGAVLGFKTSASTDPDSRIRTSD